MATTQKGIYYNTNYSEAADVLADEKAMAESIDKALDDSEKGLKEQLADKVDKVAGKGLSTNDFTNEEKAKLASLHNYDDTDLAGRVSTAEGDIGEIKEEQSSQNTSIQNNTEAIEVLQAKNAELEQEISDLEDNQLTGQASGTEIYISDSAKAKNRSVGITGRSTQESTTGKNKLNCGNPLAVTGSVNIPCDLPAGSYTISCSKTETTGTTNYMVQATYEDNTNGYFSMYKEALTGTFTLQKRTINIRLYSQDGYEHSQGVTTTFYDLMLRESSITDDTYEPYTGGEPAPNPNYPYAIKNTGDNGSVNEKISNIKNFLDWNKFIDFSSWTNALSSGYMRFKIDGLKANTKYTLCRVDDSGYNTFMYAGFNIIGNNTNLFIYSADATLNKKSATITTNSSGIVYVVFYMSSATQLQNYINLIQDCWVIEGEEYIEKQEQTLSFPLAQGQKLMEGDYPDDDEKVHHVMKEYALTGDENWLRYNNKNCYYISNNSNNPFKDCALGYKKSICSHFRQFIMAFEYNYIGTYCDHPSIPCKYFVTDKESIADWKAWLAEQYANGTPVKVQYELAQKTTEDFTEEQKTAWAEWQKARTYKGGTIISSEDETPATVDIEYVKDLETVINNLTTRVETIESEV